MVSQHILGDVTQEILAILYELQDLLVDLIKW